MPSDREKQIYALEAVRLWRTVGDSRPFLTAKGKTLTSPDKAFAVQIGLRDERRTAVANRSPQIENRN